MENKFAVIKSTETEHEEKIKRSKRVVALCNAWERQYYDLLVRACGDRNLNTIADLPQSEIMRIGLAGIKFICAIREVKRENDRLGTGYTESLEESKIKFQVIDTVFSILGCLTLRNFVTTFPITKEYDGEKWECKDYFYTMEVLSEMDWDEPIGRENLSDLLWDYMNDGLRLAYVEFTSAMSAIYRSRTGKGIAEQWCDDMGIPTYTVDRETGIIQNNQTGSTTKLKKGSHLQVVK